jgi:hypothetical protein
MMRADWKATKMESSWVERKAHVKADWMETLMVDLSVHE